MQPHYQQEYQHRDLDYQHRDLDYQRGLPGKKTRDVHGWSLGVNVRGLWIISADRFPVSL